jgi:hypothetical protein
MSNPINKKQVGQVSNWFPSNDRFLNYSQSSMASPYGLKLRQTITSTGSVTIPADITWVYAICVGAGGGGSNTYRGGGAGGVAWGWTLPSTSCIVGASGQGVAGGYTRYGFVLSGGGAGATSGAATLGGGTGPDGSIGTTNYWGVPAGTQGSYGSGAKGGVSSSPTALPGGDGISGGGGGFANPATGTATGGAGGNGVVGGGGGGAITTTGTRIGGKGGNGINIATGEVTIGGAGATGVNTAGGAGGGAGTAENGFAAVGLAGGNGGLGGGGGGGGSAGGSQTVGGSGVIYLYY